MRIGILTFHRAKNYGAMLQAYSLQQILGKRYETEILDYRNPFIEKSYYLFKQGPKRVLKRTIKLLMFRKKERQLVKKDLNFASFSCRYLTRSRKYSPNNIYKANCNYDVIIAGSDQVWNPKWSDNDWHYFLDFVDDEKKMSYAASMSSTIRADEIARMRQELEGFREVIVREQDSVDRLKELDIYPCAVAACDPVFFFSRDEWKSQCSLKHGEGKYVLVYLVAKATYAIDFARRIAREEGLELIYLNLVGIPCVPEGFVDVRDAGPIEFLNYVLNAKYVVTTSFHGLAFSAIFHVPFFYELCDDNGNVNSRLENLAKIIGVSNRRITESYRIEGEIDWDEIDRLIVNYAESSKELLFRTVERIIAKEVK